MAYITVQEANAKSTKSAKVLLDDYNLTIIWSGQSPILGSLGRYTL